MITVKMAPELPEATTPLTLEDLKTAGWHLTTGGAYLALDPARIRATVEELEAANGANEIIAGERDEYRLGLEAARGLQREFQKAHERHESDALKASLHRQECDAWASKREGLQKRNAELRAQLATVRAAALEEAAQLADREAVHGYAGTCHDISNGIRMLAK